MVVLELRTPLVVLIKQSLSFQMKFLLFCLFDVCLKSGVFVGILSSRQLSISLFEIQVFSLIASLLTVKLGKPREQ